MQPKRTIHIGYGYKALLYPHTYRTHCPVLNKKHQLGLGGLRQKFGNWVMKRSRIFPKEWESYSIYLYTGVCVCGCVYTLFLSSVMEGLCFLQTCWDGNCGLEEVVWGTLLRIYTTVDLRRSVCVCVCVELFNR